MYDFLRPIWIYFIIASQTGLLQSFFLQIRPGDNTCPAGYVGYLLLAVTTIELFDDRLEISNPGGLVSAIPISDFGKRSHSRNPLIFGLFARMRIVEQIGSGIARMRGLMVQAGLPEPIFDMTGMFTVTLMRPLKTSEKTSEKTRDKMIRLIKDNTKITIEELAQKIGKTTRTIEIHLNKLKEDGLIKRVGPDKGGHWEIEEI